MTTVHLVRHGVHSALGHRIVGRAPDVHLSAGGLTQAERVAERLSSVPVAAVYSGPLERARETAAVIAQRHGIGVDVAAAIDELDYGAWTDKSLDALRREPVWEGYNTLRSLTRIPSGELMLEAQARAVTFLEALRAARPDDHVVVVSHGDVIRAALAYVLGMPLDFIQRLEISPGSVSTVSLEPWGPKLLRMNETGDAQ